MLFQFFNPAEKVTVTQGHLPHWDQAGATYFITWRTADSIPKEIWKRWTDERDAWLITNGIDPHGKDWRRHLEGLPEEMRLDFRRFTRVVERELDACHGDCVLKAGKLGGIVRDALHFFDGSRYTLGDFVVMPNHVHLLVGGLPRNTMLDQVESWKKWTALQINAALGRKGRFWQDESFDHLVRNAASFEKLKNYIRDNPAKAFLKEGEFILWQRPQ